MLKFLGRRILFIAAVCFLIVFAAHLGMRMANNSQSPQPNYDLVRQSKLSWMETRAYAGMALKGDFGVIVVKGVRQPVTDLLKEAYVNSMGLLAASMLVGVTLGLAFGAFGALTQRQSLVMPLLALTVLGISTPSFFAGLLLRQAEVLYVAQGNPPLVSVAGFGWDLRHMLLPALVLAARPLAYLARATFVALDRAMKDDYIRTAFSKGLTAARTVNVHAARNVAVPVLTAAGVSLRFALGALPVVEFLFMWPGLGLRMLEAINAGQTQVVAALGFALGLTFLTINLLLDVAYRFIDPRLRASG